MDWIRRNWPDLLIGIALVAVIAGIIATLLTGGSFFPLGGGGRDNPNTPNTGGTVQSGPLDPVTVTDNSDRQRGTGDVPTTGNAQTDTSPDVNTGNTANADADTMIGQGTGAGVQVNPLPLPGTSQTDRQAEQDGTGTQTTANQPANTTSNTTPEAPDGNTGTTNLPSASDVAATVGTAAAGPVLPTATAGLESEGSYRISVGAFTATENAERQAQTFRSAGYPVFIGSQGNLSIVLVGPYADLNEAERVAQAIRAGDFDIAPVIYRYQADVREGAEAGASTNGTGTAGTTSTTDTNRTEAQETSDAPVLTESSTGVDAGESRFLQVGAYANVESAMPQRERLEALGFRVSDVSEGNLIKLLVGPFAGEELSAARSRLDAQGIEHFPR